MGTFITFGTTTGAKVGKALAGTAAVGATMGVKVGKALAETIAKVTNLTVKFSENNGDNSTGTVQLFATGTKLGQDAAKKVVDAFKGIDIKDLSACALLGLGTTIGAKLGVDLAKKVFSK